MPELGISEGTALGCSVQVVTTDPAGIAAARRAVDAVLSDIDQACSRFRADSELRALNAAGGAEVTLSPLLNQALAVALRAAEASDGAVDPTVGTAVRLAGYDRDFALVAPEGGPLTLTVRPVPGWRGLAHHARARRLRMPAGVELDLGATAKALAADLAAEAALHALGGGVGGGVLVNLGGDIAVAGEAPGGGWRVQVSEDSAASLSESEQTIAIASGGLATSSTTIRRWNRGGVELHHLIDPETGRPAAGPWRSATVHAATCVDANTASTAAIVKGEAAAAWLARAGLPARLVRFDGSVVKLGGWP